jgi:hypothetical protein
MASRPATESATAAMTIPSTIQIPRLTATDCLLLEMIFEPLS